MIYKIIEILFPEIGITKMLDTPFACRLQRMKSRRNEGKIHAKWSSQRTWEPVHCLYPGAFLLSVAPPGRWSPLSVPITDGRNHNNKSVTGRKDRGGWRLADGRRAVWGPDSSPHLIDDDE